MTNILWHFRKMSWQGLSVNSRIVLVVAILVVSWIVALAMFTQIFFPVLGLLFLTLVWLIALPVAAMCIIYGIVRLKMKITVYGLMIILHVTGTVVVGREIESSFIERAFSTGNTIAEAIDRFRDDAGFYPDSLTELTPAYIESIPDARFHLVGSTTFWYRSEYNTFYLRFRAGDGWGWYEVNSRNREWAYHD